ncbi:MAG: AAA family ATPase [Candidatus Poribacteria bacterium]|nr:AAA family ATPase [Candidatus Poribacteria bacterium]
MFWEKIESQFKVAAAHQFLLHFNVSDLQYDEAFGYLPTVDYLMEQLNVLGCRLVLGYNATQGFAWPNIGKWLETQKILGLIPKDQGPPEETDNRKRINSQLALHKLHEDPFLKSDPLPTKDLANKMHDLLKQDRVRIGLIINHLEQIAPNDSMFDAGATDNLQFFFHQLQNWASDLEIRRKKHIILLLTQNTYDIHPHFLVNQEIPIVEVPFPDYDERLKFIEHLNTIPQEISHQDSPDTKVQVQLNLGNDREKQTLARDAAGLNLFAIHDLVRHATSLKQKVEGRILANYRRESVKTFSHGIIEVNEPLTEPKQHWSSHVTRVIQDIVGGLNEQDLRRVPRGILLLGPTGNGNIFAARMLAGQTNMAFVRLRYASQVSEVTINVNDNGAGYDRNLNSAINFIRGLAPVVVFMDEIEQVSPHASMKTANLERPFPVILTNAISDASLHGQVIWVGTSSRPDLIPPIFRRPDIFNHKLVLLPPIRESRAGILQFFCRFHTQAEINFQEIARHEKLRGVSVNDLNLIAQRSHNVAKRKNRNTFTEEDLREVVSDFMPDYSPEMRMFMVLLALQEANSRAMLPDRLPPPYREFVNENQIDKTKINARLMELGQELGLSA